MSNDEKFYDSDGREYTRFDPSQVPPVQDSPAVDAPAVSPADEPKDPPAAERSAGRGRNKRA